MTSIHKNDTTASTDIILVIETSCYDQWRRRTVAGVRDRFGLNQPARHKAKAAMPQVFQTLKQIKLQL